MRNSLFLLGVGLCLVGTSVLSFAGVARNQITSVSKAKDSSSNIIDIHFEKPFSSKSLSLELNRNIIQYVLKNTTISNAKLVPIGENKIQKVFAYSYNPDTARVRVILDDQAVHFKDRISVKNINSKTVRIAIKNLEKNELKSEIAKGKEKEILGEVFEKTKEIDLNSPESVKKAIFSKKEEEKGVPPSNALVAAVTGEVSKDSPQLISSIEKESESSIGVKKDPSRGFVRMALFMFGIIALLGLLAFGAKKYSSSFKKLPFGKKERLIQVVATHYLGGKKSLSLVKIAGEFMVIGVANENISLISKMDPQKNIDQMLEDRFWGGTFEKHLDTYSNDSSVAKEESKLNYDGPRDLSLSDNITDKVEISSFRSSLKEKIGNLKPLDRT